jgi:hypothetical protein
MFAVGHTAISYLIGKILGRKTHQVSSIAMLWIFALLPDVDLLFSPVLEHRGPTHSLILATIIFAPIFLVSFKKAVPYYAALVSHSLIGDYFTDGGVAMFWPILPDFIRSGTFLAMGASFEVHLELALFLTMFLSLIVSRDFHILFDSGKMNNLLFIPLATVVLPIMFKFPMVVPPLLFIPHIILMGIMIVSFSISFIRLVTTMNRGAVTFDRVSTLIGSAKMVKLQNEESTENIEELEKQKNELLGELRKLKRKPEGKIGYVLLALGSILLGLAIVYSHNVAAFIGIALVFWGALLLYVRPTRFIRREILDSTVLDPILSMQKSFEEMDFKGTPRHVSPATISGMRGAVLLIPKSDETELPTDEQLSLDVTVIANPSAVKLTPPGLGLSRLIESELRTNFSVVDLGYLQNSLEKAIVEGLEIADDFEMEINEPNIVIKVRGSVFYDVAEALNRKEGGTKFGDPLSSAMACILARSTRRPVVIEKIESEPKTRAITTTFELGGSAIAVKED